MLQYNKKMLIKFGCLQPEKGTGLDYSMLLKSKACHYTDIVWHNIGKFKKQARNKKLA